VDSAALLFYNMNIVKASGHSLGYALKRISHLQRYLIRVPDARPGLSNASFPQTMILSNDLS
jgi:hypothetical protein